VKALSHLPDCRADFKATVDASRAKHPPLTIAGWLAIPFWLGFAFVHKYRAVGLAGFLTCWSILFFGGLLTRVKLMCPACGLDADGLKGKFCPECGGEIMRERGFWDIFPPRCLACDKSLVSGRGGRRYKIRYCRQCGAHLDDEGV
jgi:predicted RNA-binding Zn-ribbon protein involved in translation (DUF1610 family)